MNCMNIEVETLTLYHGSFNQKGIPQPRRDIPGHTFGRIDMDFGTGFYLTPNANQAKEWAVRKGNNGSLNTYRLNIDGLHILHLEPEACCPLCWMTVMLYFRGTRMQRRDKHWLIDNYYLDVDSYDLVCGLTADDQYYRIFNDFVTNQLSYRGLCKALLLGGLGRQYVIKSIKGYENLHFLNCNTVFSEIWLSRGSERHRIANEQYDVIQQQHCHSRDELFLADIISERIMPNDTRLAFKCQTDFDEHDDSPCP